VLLTSISRREWFPAPALLRHISAFSCGKATRVLTRAERKLSMATVEVMPGSTILLGCKNDVRQTLPSENFLLRQLISGLDAEDVRYCRWKGNTDLQRVLDGEGDLDLLVDRKDVAKFQGVLARLKFRRAIAPVWPHLPGMEHYYGLDRTTGVLIHLHINYLLIAGESLSKGYRLPVEELILQHVTRLNGGGCAVGMPVVQAKAELIVFVLRMMLKYSTLTEYLLTTRSDADLQVKLQTLLVDGAARQAKELLERWLPGVPPELFYECLDSLQQGTSPLHRYLLARKLRRFLRPYRRFSLILDAAGRFRALVSGITWRLLHGRTGRKELDSGGAIIAFVGSDPSECLTLAVESRRWLGKVCRVCHGHLHTPRSTWITLLPRFAGRILSGISRLASAAGLRRTSRCNAAGSAGNSNQSVPGTRSLLQRFQAVLDAWDARAMAVRLFHKAANGWLVIYDSYPSIAAGTIHGNILLSGVQQGEGRVAHWLTNLEGRIYQKMPPPDIVVQLAAQDDAVKQCSKSFPNARIIEFDSNLPAAQRILTLRRLLWEG
jgi:hypothetical protein